MTAFSAWCPAGARRGPCDFSSLFGLAVCQCSCQITINHHSTSCLMQLRDLAEGFHELDELQPHSFFFLGGLLVSQFLVNRGYIFGNAGLLLFWTTTRFVIKWPVSRIDESLVSFLTNLPLDVARRYIANGRNVR